MESEESSILGSSSSSSMLDISSASSIHDQPRPLLDNEIAPTTSTPAIASGSSLQSIEVSSPNINHDWHLSFTIPDLKTFPASVQDAVRSGIVDGRARREITQVLRTYICAHTITPTPEQYKTVCKALIMKFPSLQDTAEGQSKYGSWKLGLRNAFKNFRKKMPKEDKRKASPVPKRLRLCNEEESDMDEEEYATAVQDLKAEYTKVTQKKGGSYAELKRLMEATKTKRRYWIRNSEPMLSKVIENFPVLSSSRWIRLEFKELVSYEANINKLMETWPEWRRKIMALAKLEAVHRPLIKKLVDILDEEDEDLHSPDDHKDVVCLDILNRLFFP
ncbi:uncharacterized protein [Dysidea avara]|uniref:uncharacterized protein n=1 Tax=Dysidea avara TaxID=196820 RepID=UPI0033318C99